MSEEAAEGFEDRALQAESEVEELLQQLMDMLEHHWEHMEEHFNPGQLTIYYDYMIDIIMSWEQMAYDQWPWVDAGEYSEALWWSYDTDVLARAFSEAIDGPLEKMYDIIAKAQEAQEQAELMEFLAFMAEMAAAL